MRRNASLAHDLSITYRQLYYTKNRLIQRKKRNDTKNALVYPQLFHGVLNAFIIVFQVLSLVLGFPGQKLSYLYHRNILLEKKKQTQIRIQLALQSNKSVECDIAFLQWFYMTEDELRELNKTRSY